MALRAQLSVHGPVSDGSRCAGPADGLNRNPNLANRTLQRAEEGVGQPPGADFPQEVQLSARLAAFARTFAGK